MYFSPTPLRSQARISDFVWGKLAGMLAIIHLPLWLCYNKQIQLYMWLEVEKVSMPVLLIEMTHFWNSGSVFFSHRRTVNTQGWTEICDHFLVSPAITISSFLPLHYSSLGWKLHSLNNRVETAWGSFSAVFRWQPKGLWAHAEVSGLTVVSEDCVDTAA